MKWNPSRLYAPRSVSTPGVADDIQRYFYPEGGVRAQLAALPGDQNDKLMVLAERLEFIEHLITFAREIGTHKQQTSSIERLDKTRAIWTLHDKIVMRGHDFAGVDYDIEALVQYLLLTCIDTIKGDPTKKGGYTKVFVSAFTNDLSPNLKRRLVEGFAVLHVVDSSVLPEEAAIWEGKSDTDKARAVAEKLYDIRSRFSHNSIRSFFPAQPVDQLQTTTCEVLIKVRGDEDLFRFLWDSVVFLARKLLLKLDIESATEGGA